MRASEHRRRRNPGILGSKRQYPLAARSRTQPRTNYVPQGLSCGNAAAAHHFTSGRRAKQKEQAPAYLASAPKRVECSCVVASTSKYPTILQGPAKLPGTRQWLRACHSHLTSDNFMCAKGTSFPSDSNPFIRFTGLSESWGHHLASPWQGIPIFPVTLPLYQMEPCCGESVAHLDLNKNMS